MHDWAGKLVTGLVAEWVHAEHLRAQAECIGAFKRLQIALGHCWLCPPHGFSQLLPCADSGTGVGFGDFEVALWCSTMLQTPHPPPPKKNRLSHIAFYNVVPVGTGGEVLWDCTPSKSSNMSSPAPIYAPVDSFSGDLAAGIPNTIFALICQSVVIWRAFSCWWAVLIPICSTLGGPMFSPPRDLAFYC